MNGPNSPFPFLASAPLSTSELQAIEGGGYPVARVRVKHPIFGYGPAYQPPSLRPSGQRYAQTLATKMTISYKKRRFEEFQRAACQVNRFFLNALKFKDLFVESDIEDLKTTCHMGARPRSHAQSDEGRSVGSTAPPIVWRESVWKRVAQDWSPVVERLRASRSFDDLKLVLPTGTSLGWPYLFSDDKEGSRSLVLAAIALMVATEKGRGSSLSAVLSALAATYGPRFIAPGWRYQHSAKPMPVLAGDGLFWTTNVEFRTRLIAMVDKVSIVWNRKLAKRAVATALHMPAHNQDRSYLKTTISKWLAEKDRQVIAVDVSGFDNGLGGANLLKILEVYDKLFTFPGEKSSFQDLVAEVSAPMMVPVGSLIWETEQKITPQLPSGASFTTVVGLLASDYIRHLIATLAGLEHGDAPGDMRSLSWGDDMVISLPKSIDVPALFRKTSAEMRLEFDFEPTIKYLGMNYGDGVFKTRVGYSRGRLLQKSVFPESMSAYPFSIIGYVARLQFVEGDARRFHELFSALMWDVSRYGPPFLFDQRVDVLQKALKDSLQTTRGHADSLNFLLHGLDPIEGQVLLNDIDFDFTQWIGKSFIDLTDPYRVRETLTGQLATVSIPLLKAVEREGVTGLTSMVTTLAPIKKWRVEGVIT